MLLLGLCPLVAGCGSRVEASALQVLVGETMGSTYELKWHGQGAVAVAALLREELEAADATFSLWRPDSEIVRFNGHAGGEPFGASELLREAVALALQLAEWSEGAFDPTCGPLTELYRLQRDGGEDVVLNRAAWAEALALVGYQRLRIVGDSLVKDDDEMQIDLDGLVAGLVADRLGGLLREADVEGFMLEITGEVLCYGRKPDGSLWRIGIVDPERSDPLRERAVITVPLRDRALCTSGSYRNFTIVDGQLRTHVWDPRTGETPDHGVISASVLATSCALADGLATALMVVGPEGAEALLERAGQGARIGGWLVTVMLPEGSPTQAPDEPVPVLRSQGVNWPEAFSLEGRPLFRPELSPEVLADRVARYEAALAAAAAAPDDVTASVWLGRRLGYLSRFDEAIEVYSKALERHPDEPRLLRHRGHRFLSVRKYLRAREDLARAAVLTQERPDEIEPDGLPYPGRPPHSTLQFNIYYHLALAHWCLGDAGAAAAAWRDCLATVAPGNDEARVAVTHWLWCAMQRGGQAEDVAVAELLAPVGEGLDVVENRAYYDLCRLYRGDLRFEDLAAGEGSSGAALAYGLANFARLRARPEARQMLEALAADAGWAAFGVLAAEADLHRLPAK